jgi:hypothetical protein
METKKGDRLENSDQERTKSGERLTNRRFDGQTDSKVLTMRDSEMSVTSNEGQNETGLISSESNE